MLCDSPFIGLSKLCMKKSIDLKNWDAGLYYYMYIIIYELCRSKANSCCLEKNGMVYHVKYHEFLISSFWIKEGDISYYYLYLKKNTLISGCSKWFLYFFQMLPI